MPYSYNSSGRGVGVGYCNGCKTRRKLTNGFCARCRKFGVHNDPDFQNNNKNTPNSLSREEKLKKRKERMEKGELSGVSAGVNANVTRDNVNFDIDKSELQDRQNPSNTPKDISADDWAIEKRKEIEKKKQEARKEGKEVSDINIQWIN